GMAISKIKTLVFSMQSEARNSSADENARTVKANSRNKSGSDSRTDSSSSTTDTSGRLAITNASWFALQPLRSRRRGGRSHLRQRMERKRKTSHRARRSPEPTGGLDDGR